MLKQISTIFILAITIAYLSNANAQVNSYDSLDLKQIKARLDSLEAAEKKLKAFITQVNNNQQLTGKTIESGEYGGFVVADENTRVNIGGFIKTNLYRDFRQMNSVNYFSVSQIPVNNSTDNKYSTEVYSSRFYINSAVKTKNFNFKTRFEFDFLGNPDGTSFRIRHAYAEAGRFGVGKTYSNFSNIDASPDILDNGGGPGEIAIKQIQAKYMQPINSSLRFVFAIEEPNCVLYNTNNENIATSLFPDIIGNMRFKFGNNDRSHIQIAGVAHPVTYYNNENKRKTNYGLGANICGNIKVAQSDYVDFQISYGKGISKYYNDPATHFDGRVNFDTDVIELKEMYGSFIYYHHNWSQLFASNIGYNFIGTNNDSYTQSTDEKQGHYASANFIYYPNNKVALGLEYMYGVRENVSGETGSNGRLQLQALFTF